MGPRWRRAAAETTDYENMSNTCKFTLRDTFNGFTVSAHMSLEAAVAADIKFGQAVKRANGQSSYIPTEILCDGERLSDDQIEQAWAINESLRNR